MNKTLFNLVLILPFMLSVLACNKDNSDNAPSDLEQWISQQQEDQLEEDYLIACAAGNSAGVLGNPDNILSIFEYVVDEAKDFRLFKSIETISDPLEYRFYEEIELPLESIVDGRMKRYSSDDTSIDDWFVLTYQSPGKYHVSEPIKIKTAIAPTAGISDSISVTENGSNPIFEWVDSRKDENVIYFQLITDASDRMVSGTYTEQNNFEFYNLDNVVLNVTPDENPVLTAGNYTFTLMGVGADNWVNSFGAIPFEIK